MADENPSFLEDSVSQDLGHRIWDPATTRSTTTERLPLRLYAGVAGVSGAGVPRVLGGRVTRIVWFMQLGELLRVGVHATRAGRGGRVVRASRPAGRIVRVGQEGGGRPNRGLPAHAVIQRRAGRPEICRTSSVITPHHVLMS